MFTRLFGGRCNDFMSSTLIIISTKKQKAESVLLKNSKPADLHAVTNYK
jgi:hypothetical protein